MSGNANGAWVKGYRLECVGIDDSRGLEEWDAFNLQSERGHYCQLSPWLASFSAYGFRFEVVVAREEKSGRVVGGLGLLKYSTLGFRIVTSPIGPILETGYEHLGRPLIEASLDRARRNRAMLFQLTLPCAEQNSVPAVYSEVSLPVSPEPRDGIVFGVGNAPNQMLWIEFPQEADSVAWRSLMLKRFNENTRRAIKHSDKAGVQVREATSVAEIREGYRLIEENGREQGYATRAWKDIGRTLQRQVQARQAVMLTAEHDGRVVGAHYGVLAGRRYSYLMGGTVRLKPDPHVGHLLHWTAITKAREMGLAGYDLTSGGSAGVMRFKMGFRPTQISFVRQRHFVLSPARYRVFSCLYGTLRRQKKLVASLLSLKARLSRGKAGE